MSKFTPLRKHKESIRPVVWLLLIGAITLSVLAIVLVSQPGSRSGTLDMIEGCSLNGSATAPVKMADNRLKNRYELPTPGDFDRSITLDHLLHARGEDALSDRVAVTIEGFVHNVKIGGIESCNCRRTDAAGRDTHMEITPSLSSDDKRVVICEVTPRIRAIVARSGKNWTTAALKALIGKHVRLSGWLYFDPDHVNESDEEDPGDRVGQSNWRATSWEVHPITEIEVLP